MALNEVKKQVVSMLQSILTLESCEQVEAMGFLQDCITDFGLSLPKNLTNADKSKDCDNDANDVGTNENAPVSPEVTEDQDSVCDEKAPATDLSQESKSSDAPASSTEGSDENGVVRREVKKREKKIKTKKTGKKTVQECKIKNKTKSDEDNVENTNDISIGETGAEGEDEEPNMPDERIKDAKVHKCPGCATSCQSKTALLLHFKTHSDAAMSCRICRNPFASVSDFWDHKRTRKCKAEALQCSDCNEKFKHRRHYLKHVLGHKDNNCRYCEEKFSTWANYKNHLKEKHPDIKMERDLIPCKFCPMSFRRHIGLYNHYRVKHSKGKFVCLSCGLLLPTKEKHKEHVMVHESEKNWKCKICKMKFYRRQQLLLHVSIHKLGIYKCLTCEITVTSKAELRKHKKDGHDVRGLERKFECEICHKTFAKRFTLGNHLATHSKDKCYTCKYCVKSFRTLDSLNRHQKRKSHFEKAKITIPESKYEKVYEDKLICEKCGKQYKTQRELKCHLIVHKSLYDCNECGKTFTLKFNLTKHLRLHRNPVGVVCELCGDTFNQLSALNEHCLMKHSDVRKAKCEICQKAFKRKSELNRHLRTHEYKRPFACFCGKAYKQSAHLRNHYKSAHGSAKQANLDGGEAIPDYHHDNNDSGEMYRDMEKRKKEYVDGDGGNALVPLDNIESETVFRSSAAAASYIGMQMNESHDGKVPYVPNYGIRYPQGDMEGINVNYEDLNYGSSQTDKRGLVFASPAVDLSMVNIPEVVQNGIDAMDGAHHHDADESFNKISDDSSQIQLLNLSEHIVQEYLLNLQ